MNVYLRMQYLIVAFSVFVLGGCAHKVTVVPDATRLIMAGNQSSIQKPVGYFISEQNRVKHVITPAGGGDKIEYAPYADFEPGLATVLRNVFGTVHTIKDLNDKEFLQKNNISWVFTPTLVTDSSSRNAFFWPPTDFSVNLECVATDIAHQPVWKTSISAKNNVVSVNEVKKKFGLAGEKAMEEALIVLQAQISSAPEFRK